MASKPYILVLSEVDGIFVGGDDVAFEAAAVEFAYLQQDGGVAIVLCSHRPRSDVAVVQRRLRLEHPFICEPSASIVVPSAYFPFEVAGRLDQSRAGAGFDEAAAALCEAYRRAFGPIVTIGVTDNSTATSLLPCVWHGVIVDNDAVSYDGDGIVEWAAAVVDAVRLLPSNA